MFTPRIGAGRPSQQARRVDERSVAAEHDDEVGQARGAVLVFEDDEAARAQIAGGSGGPSGGLRGGALVADADLARELDRASWAFA